jgi:hypothetical protein
VGGTGFLGILVKKLYSMYLIWEYHLNLGYYPCEHMLLWPLTWFACQYFYFYGQTQVNSSLFWASFSSKCYCTTSVLIVFLKCFPVKLINNVFFKTGCFFRGVFVGAVLNPKFMLVVIALLVKICFYSQDSSFELCYKIFKLYWLLNCSTP